MPYSRVSSRPTSHADSGLSPPPPLVSPPPPPARRVTRCSTAFNRRSRNLNLISIPPRFRQRQLCSTSRTDTIFSCRRRRGDVTRQRRSSFVRSNSEWGRRGAKRMRHDRVRVPVAPVPASSTHKWLDYHIGQSRPHSARHHSRSTVPTNRPKCSGLPRLVRARPGPARHGGQRPGQSAAVGSRYCCGRSVRLPRSRRRGSTRGCVPDWFPFPVNSITSRQRGSRQSATRASPSARRRLRPFLDAMHWHVNNGTPSGGRCHTPSASRSVD